MVFGREGLHASACVLVEKVWVLPWVFPPDRIFWPVEKKFSSHSASDNFKGTGKDAVSREAEFIGFLPCDLVTFCPLLKQFFGF